MKIHRIYKEVYSVIRFKDDNAEVKEFNGMTFYYHTYRSYWSGKLWGCKANAEVYTNQEHVEKVFEELDNGGWDVIITFEQEIEYGNHNYRKNLPHYYKPNMGIEIEEVDWDCSKYGHLGGQNSDGYECEQCEFRCGFN